MLDDAIAGSSLLQTHADQVHHKSSNKHQHNLHKALHRRQTDAAANQQVTTVSLIQQVIVDSTGNIIETSIVTPDPGDSATMTDAATPTIPTTAPAVAAPVTTSSLADTTNTPSIGAAVGTNTTDISITTTSQASVLASALSLSSQSGISANSSIPTGSISALNQTTNGLLSNQTLSVTTTALKSKSGSDSDSDSIFSTTSYASTTGSDALATSGVASFLSTTTNAAGIVIVGGVPIATATLTRVPTASTSAAGNTDSSSTNSSPPPTPVLVGSVVGGVAGTAFIVFILLFLLRWHKRSRGILSLNRGGGSSQGAITSREGPAPSQPGGMTERAVPFAIPAALATLTGRNKRASHAKSASSTAGSERGFYRVSGRKLPSVLQSGGDGFGGGFDDRPMFSNPDTLSGTSFYRDSQGFHGGPGIQFGSNRDSGVPIVRPSPGRTPVMQHGAFASPPRENPFASSQDNPFDSPPPPPRLPDSLGRSHASQDGSHTSRFTEEIV